MEFNKIGLIGGMLLAFATTLSAAPTTVNDGKNMNNLTKIENKLNDANATIDLKVALRNGRWPIGHLEMVQSADITFPALRAAWYSEKLIPADNDYTLSAEFQPAAEEGMGGVISLLNNETGVAKKHRKMECIEKFLEDLGTDKSLISILHQSAMFFMREVRFDANPDLFQLKNCVLDLRTNTFVQTKAEHMCLRCSDLTIPPRWLRDPSLIEAESANDGRRSGKSFGTFSVAADANARTASASAPTIPRIVSTFWATPTRNSSSTCGECSHSSLTVDRAIKPGLSGTSGE